jgi:hypothetical protein
VNRPPCADGRQYESAGRSKRTSAPHRHDEGRRYQLSRGSLQSRRGERGAPWFDAAALQPRAPDDRGASVRSSYCRFRAAVGSLTDRRAVRVMELTE